MVFAVKKVEIFHQTIRMNNKLETKRKMWYNRRKNAEESTGYGRINGNARMYRGQKTAEQSQIPDKRNCAYSIFMYIIKCRQLGRYGDVGKSLYRFVERISSV